MKRFMIALVLLVGCATSQNPGFEVNALELYKFENGQDVRIEPKDCLRGCRAYTDYTMNEAARVLDAQAAWDTDGDFMRLQTPEVRYELQRYNGFTIVTIDRP